MYFDLNIPYIPEVDNKNTDRLRLILARFSSSNKIIRKKRII